MSWLSWLTAPTTAIIMAAPPGALNPTVTQSTIHQTICSRGWTAMIRPPWTYTNDIKRGMLPPGTTMADYELDHMIPLELGGHPTARANLWLQPWDGPCGARAKDHIEDELRRKVCRGDMTLSAAQAEIVRSTRECKS